MTHTSSFFASWERLGNRITPRESYPINFLLALLDGASIADIRVCVQREYISNGHRRDSRALCANLQRSQRTRSYRPRRSPATRSTRFTIQPVIRLLFIRALSLSLPLSTIYEALPRFFRSCTAYLRSLLGNGACTASLSWKFRRPRSTCRSYSIDPRDDAIVRTVH